MLTSADIREKLSQRPFAPFRIMTSSGQYYDIVHPEFAMVGRRDVIVGTPIAEDDPDFDQFHIVAIMHISALEALPTHSAKT